MAASLAQGLPEGAVTIVNEHLSGIPAAARTAHAAHIQQAMAAHTAAQVAGMAAPLLGLLMPNLHAVTVVVTGSHSEWQCLTWLSYCLIELADKLFLGRAFPCWHSTQ